MFLKASVKHFLSKERDKTNAGKRGGRADVVSLDTEEAEGRYQHEPVDRMNPEEIYERRWALTLLERVLGRLERDFAETGKEAEFEHLRNALTGEEPQLSYREMASHLGSTEAAVKTSVHRLRKRFGSLLREEIAGTVANPEDVDDEVRYLLGVVVPWGPTA